MTPNAITTRTGDGDTLPPLTAAASDLLCWMWAAFPPKNGRIHVRTAATAMGVSDTTIRRWLRRTGDPQWLPPAQVKLLVRRSNLRGHGDYLWAPLDNASRIRRAAQAVDAHLGHQAVTADPEGAGIAGAEHTIYQVYYPAARVFGLVAGTTPDTPRKASKRGLIIDTAPAPNRHAARLVITAALDLYGDDNVIPPRTLLPIGRTQTWLRRAGSLDLQGATRTVLRDLNQ